MMIRVELFKDRSVLILDEENSTLYCTDDKMLLKEHDLVLNWLQQYFDEH